jgi:hypothetical protein
VVDDIEDPRRTEPAYVADERTMLEAWLEFHRMTLLLKGEGVDRAGLLLHARRSGARLTCPATDEPADGRNSWLEGAKRAGWPGRRLWARVASVRRSPVRRSRSGTPVLAGHGQPTSPQQVAMDRGHHHAVGAGAPGITDTLTQVMTSAASSSALRPRRQRCRPAPRADATMSSNAARSLPALSITLATCSSVTLYAAWPICRARSS